MIIEGYTEKWKNQVAYLRTFKENIAEDFIWELLENGYHVISINDEMVTYYNANMYFGYSHGVALSLEECVEKTESALAKHKAIYIGTCKEV